MKQRSTPPPHAREIEALAREIAEECGLRMPEARIVARAEIGRIHSFAAEWDARAAARRPATPPTA